MIIDDTRNGMDLVYDTLYDLLIEEVIPSGKVYLGSPDPIYINERTEEINNIDDTRYPCISIVPLKTFIDKTPKQEIYGDINLTGDTEYWYSKSIMRETHELTLATATKNDWRILNNRLNLFFDKYRNGIILKRDVLPNGFKDSFSIMLDKGSIYDLAHSPFLTICTIRIAYNMWVKVDATVVSKFITNMSSNIDELSNSNTEIIITE